VTHFSYLLHFFSLFFLKAFTLLLSILFGLGPIKDRYRFPPSQNIIISVGSQDRNRSQMVSKQNSLIRHRRERGISPPLAAFHCLYNYPAALRRGSSFPVVIPCYCYHRGVGEKALFWGKDFSLKADSKTIYLFTADSKANGFSRYVVYSTSRNNCYCNIIVWRNGFAHEGKHPNVTPPRKVTKADEVGKKGHSRMAS
jgi:hypothetical protein